MGARRSPISSRSSSAASLFFGTPTRTNYPSLTPQSASSPIPKRFYSTRKSLYTNELGMFQKVNLVGSRSDFQ
ncbi:hypothetical protein RHMOL_Rhmol12G0182500 [Rhododendron molle]|uniref:Uncharacterized protein n=1 Tax=Rhododendron molle TaxID=49168 RepID=A0ACC0LKH9_RHOML|nr:hypothetical protein RHMOL_Rhmol12G0182500 [Rhododendron molle]